jgi:hypothetical protein
VVEGLVQATVELDAFLDGEGRGLSFTAWLRQGEEWNGCACPHFEREEADRVLAAELAAGFHGRYDPAQDA